MVLYRVLLLTIPLVLAFGSEQGTYVNPNPRQYENCEVLDLVQLAGCCNDVLRQLDGCKANDLACECCALQSMDKSCYGLCEGNPSSNFLSTLYEDCTSMNDINACNLPFKKEDTLPDERVRKPNSEDPQVDYVLKSRLGTEQDEEDENDDEDGDDEDQIYGQPGHAIVELEGNVINTTIPLNYTKNYTNASAMYSTKSNNSSGKFHCYSSQLATIITLISLYIYY